MMRSQQQHPAESGIEVVIPTLNAGREIAALITALKTQTLPPVTITVVDSSSSDNTILEAKRAGVSSVTVIEREDFDHGGTRHEALASSKAGVVLFLTQDAIPADRFYIANLLAPFSDPQVVMASGRQLPKHNARRFEQLIRAFNYPAQSCVRNASDVDRLGIKAFYASDVCSAYRRKECLSSGGITHPCNTNEDMLTAARLIQAGYKVAYAADACVLHSHNLTPKEQYRRNFEIGLSLERHCDLIGGTSEIGAGITLVKKVSAQLIKEGRPLELCAFGVDCAARLFGNRSGRSAGRKERATQ